MINKENNYAFIDGQNLNLGVQELGWRIDLRKFRIYLKEKYGVKKAFYFIGFVPENNDLYTSLQNYGYILIFKPTFRNPEGKVKGNIDAELVLQAMIELNNYERAIIVTGDGDFHCLVKYLKQRNKLKIVLSPNTNCSSLLRKAAAKEIDFIKGLRNKLEYIKVIK
ncbi:MAG: NYN domain-containing protein [Ignavibacteriae bacterium]|nr:NYN domain-containing protein [Ignavibacteriota bacterium]